MENVESEAISGNIPPVKWKEYVCGWCAAFVNITVTYPINKLIFRQMLHGVKATHAFDQLYGEGVRFLYRGIFPPLLQKTFSNAIMFGVYDEVQPRLVNHGCNVYAAKAAGGFISGTTEVILMPFERIQTLLADTHYHKQFRNTVHAFKAVGLNYGFREYYRGMFPILCRNGPSNVGFFILREEIQYKLPKCENRIYNTFNQFICGAVIGAFLSSIFYPFNVAKVAMQSKLGGNRERIFPVLVQIYNERGRKIRNVYHGVHANCTRAFISWGVVNAAYENIKVFFY